MPQFVTSAPGKVILFGEHLAVYGKPAIAAALSLRAYLLVTPNAGELITLEFPDIGLVRTWSKSAIPWQALGQVVPQGPEGSPKPTAELVPEVMDLLAPLLADCELDLHRIACRCFLYLYVNLCLAQTSGHVFCIRLTLPIGAGLGSLASTAVCLALALGVLGGHVPDPAAGHSDAAKLFIDAWSFVGEKCFHGNPLGIDNAVATYGGAVLYQRQDGGLTRQNLLGFAALNLLLTNTKIPRSTADLVGRVGVQNATYPLISEPILTAMANVVEAAHAVLLLHAQATDTLSELVSINHGLLVALGVSHPALEQVKMIADSLALGATKLTGAGGGGCAITVLTDGVLLELLLTAEAEFAKHGFECFEATLGGAGVGILKAANVPESQRDRIFDASVLPALPSREDVAALVGVAVPGWQYW